LGATDPQSACVDIVVVSDMFADPTGLACSMPPMPAGATDRLSTPNPFRFNEPGMVFDYRLQFCFAAGPALARNPHPPDALFVGTLSNNKGLAVINQAGTMSDSLGPGTDSSLPAFAGTQPIGTVVLMPNRLQNTSVLGTPSDIEVGHFILNQQAQTVTANNSLANPGRLATNIRGTPDTQNGTTPDGLLGLLGIVPPPFPPLQPWGNFLYVADSDANEVKVFNGYNFQLLTSLVGVGSPRGLAISPDLEFLYVSNFNQATVTRVFVNPVGALFHTVSTVIPVGSGPTAISVQPGNEDAFVCNFGENSFSLIDTATGLELQRFADPGAVGPSDVFITFRMLGMNLTNAYMAFIVNRFSNNVTIYESDSPAVPENGLTGTVKATRGGFFGPARGTSNWQTFILVGGPGGTGSVEPGCYIANTLGDRVDELTLQNFTLSPPPGFPGPAGQRTFRVQKSYISAGPVAGAPPSDVSIDTFSGLYNVGALGINNSKGLNDPAAGAGVPTFVIVSYPSLGLVGVWDYRSPVLRSTASVPGCDILQSYYDQ
jgi:DNA-binding beta-propeller fold protein YncE